ncbi:MAG: hypothetical protein GY940_12005 [bacterium]|nr:hypothetical protein [bacterium]
MNEDIKNRKRVSATFGVAILALIITLCLPMAAGEPYAPKAEVKEVESEKHAVKNFFSRLKKVEVPDKSKVSTPAYPGAEIIQTAKEWMGVLPYVIMVAKDDPDTVMTFYKEKMAGWGNDSINKTSRFWKDRKKKRDALHGRSPLISIRALRPELKELMPGMQTWIRISY